MKFTVSEDVEIVANGQRILLEAGDKITIDEHCGTCGVEGGVDDSKVDYSKYLISSPGGEGCNQSQYYVLRIPEGVVPPKEGDNLAINNNKVVVSSVRTPDDIAKGRGGPVARNMRENGIAYDVNCLPEGHEWLER